VVGDLEAERLEDEGEAGGENEDLWRAVDSSVAKHSIEWRWLKGHAGHVATNGAISSRLKRLRRLENFLSRSN